jgi:hypothetical protein
MKSDVLAKTAPRYEPGGQASMLDWEAIVGRKAVGDILNVVFYSALLDEIVAVPVRLTMQVGGPPGYSKFPPIIFELI